MNMLARFILVLMLFSIAACGTLRDGGGLIPTKGGGEGPIHCIGANCP